MQEVPFLSRCCFFYKKNIALTKCNCLFIRNFFASFFPPSHTLSDLKAICYISFVVDSTNCKLFFLSLSLTLFCMISHFFQAIFCIILYSKLIHIHNISKNFIVHSKEEFFCSHSASYFFKFTTKFSLNNNNNENDDNGDDDEAREKKLFLCSVVSSSKIYSTKRCRGEWRERR